jgi:hypothetical protein
VTAEGSVTLGTTYEGLGELFEGERATPSIMRSKGFDQNFIIIIWNNITGYIYSQ